MGAVIKYWSPDGERGTNSEFLLLRNRRGFWGFPQGHKERGETELQTLVREVTEETGIKSIDIQSYIGKISYSFFRGDGMKSDKEVIFILQLLIQEMLEFRKSTQAINGRPI